jgi:adenylate cyclase
MRKIVGRSRLPARQTARVAALRKRLLPVLRTVRQAVARLRRGLAGEDVPADITIGAERIEGAAHAVERLVTDAGQSSGADGAAEVTRLRHDLRNPLTVIRGFAELIQSEAKRRGLSVIAVSAQRIVTLADSASAIVDEVLKDETSVPVQPRRPRADAPAAVLVVDDDAASRELLLRLVHQGGHAGLGVASGKEALELLRNRAFDVVLLDIEMPELDGRAVLRAILADASLRETDVIVVSGVDRYDDVVACIDQGAIDYLVKPIRAELLQARIAATMMRRLWRASERDNYTRLAFAKEQADSLLSNILPEQIIPRVMAGGQVVADAFASVTILFSDFVGFTAFAAHLEPREVVASLDRLFSAFDRLALQHGVEKIKTIGDAFMAVGGLPTPTTDHAEAVARLALDMQAALAAINPTLPSPLQMRIGIATGPVIAGVIGTHKIAFDVWGHAVNMAARHESYCEPGRIHVAAETAVLLRGRFALQSRGLLHIRGGGEVETFYLGPALPTK